MREKSDDNATRCLGCGAIINDFGEAEGLDFDGMGFMCRQCTANPGKNHSFYITSIERFLNGNVI